MLTEVALMAVGRNIEQPGAAAGEGIGENLVGVKTSSTVAGDDGVCDIDGGCVDGRRRNVQQPGTAAGESIGENLVGGKASIRIAGHDGVGHIDGGRIDGRGRNIEQPATAAGESIGENLIGGKASGGVTGHDGISQIGRSSIYRSRRDIKQAGSISVKTSRHYFSESIDIAQMAHSGYYVPVALQAENSALAARIVKDSWDTFRTRSLRKNAYSETGTGRFQSLERGSGAVTVFCEYCGVPTRDGVNRKPGPLLGHQQDFTRIVVSKIRGGLRRRSCGCRLSGRSG